MAGRADYHERREARIERRRNRAEKARAEADGLHEQNHRILSVMNGTPVLSGHHSERRHRRDLAKIDARLSKACELSRKAERLDRLADAAETSEAISSDDPDALEKLRAKLAETEAAHARYKAALKPKLTKEQLSAGMGPAVVERNLIALGMSPIAADHIARMGGRGLLSNLTAEARRLRKRIAELEAAAARGLVEPERYGDVEIREEDNRVQMVFPGKPDESVRSELKANGFRWSHRSGAWQRMASNRAWYLAREIARRVEAG